MVDSQHLRFLKVICQFSTRRRELGEHSNIVTDIVLLHILLTMCFLTLHHDNTDMEDTFAG